MNILAFDTSAAHCAAAFVSDGRILSSRVEPMARGQAERLMPLLAEVLAEAGADWQSPDRIGVGIGPGNFTGIRIAVSAARGLALGRGIPAVGVSSTDALAHGTGGATVASVDARGGKLYLGVGGQPVLSEIGALPDLPAGATCIGHEASALAAHCGGRAAGPAHPLAEAIALIAAMRTPSARPVPLYVRAPDAAPATR